MKPLLLFLLIVAIKSGFAQNGCTDYRAINFSNTAITNDGSCVYNFTQVSLQYICALDTIATESSGLVFVNNNLWTHNDSDHPNCIYKIDTATGAKLQTIKVANATNNDWEDMAADNSNIYIADFGNNTGNRLDLNVYKINKNIAITDTEIAATNIKYSYIDQTNFTSNAFTNYDAEALVYIQNSLSIFTKQWGNHKTKQYQINTDSPVQVAKLIDSFDVNGLITGAAISPDEKTIALLGYDTSGKSFVWLLWDYLGSKIFGGNKRRIDFGYSGGQCEGIAFVSDKKILITNETYSIFKASLLCLNISEWIGVRPLKTIETVQEKVIYNEILKLLYLPIDHDFKTIQIYNVQGQLCFEKSIVSHDLNIPLPTLSAGIYFINLKGNNPATIKIMMH